jgi:hypothetical protein
MNGDERQNVCVILIDIDVSSLEELKELFRHLSNWQGAAHRYLIKIETSEKARALADILPQDEEVHVLSRSRLIDCPIPGASVFTMPPGSSEAEADNLLLALSDAVWLPKRTPWTDLQRRASKSGKVEVTIYGPVPWVPMGQIQQHVDNLLKLDPKVRRVWLHRFWGRVEALLIALLTFLPSLAKGFYAMGTALLAQPKEKPDFLPGALMRKRRRLFFEAVATLWFPFVRLFNVFGRRNLDPYLAPPGWRDLCPDQRLKSQCAMMTAFDTFERASGSGARCYRDLIWLAHLFAALAVLTAVAGALWLDQKVWSALEIILLLAIAVIVIRGRFGIYRRWMACRLGAEELRASILCISLFATPRLLTKSYAAASGNEASRYATSTADAKATRAVRDHGLSNLPPDFTSEDAETWVLNIAEDQLDYHRRNHRRLEELERAITFVNGALFVIVILVVAVHLTEVVHLHHLHLDGTLFFTAGGPAAVGALHSAAIQLNIAHRSRASEKCARELAKAIAGFKTSLEGAGSEALKWSAVRRLAVQTADIMSEEVETWHSTLERQPISLP